MRRKRGRPQITEFNYDNDELICWLNKTCSKCSAFLSMKEGSYGYYCKRCAKAEAKRNESPKAMGKGG